jgi:hypothetical protein
MGWTRAGLAVGATLVLISVPAAQVKQGLSDRKPKAVVGAVANAPVTQAEAAAVFKRAETVLRKLTRQPGVAKSGIPLTGAPVSRTQIVREMDRIFNLAKPAFKFTPPPVQHRPELFSLKDAASVAALKRLVGWGFVARLGPVATSSKSSLTVAEFGDAIGFFLLRMSDLTHTPSTKWSPYLQSGG